jgi:DMSO/TMAO reductase YedYZ molybdopterin-dependent catalytic subunit
MLTGAGAALLAGRAQAAVPGLNPGLPAGTREIATMVTLPGKKPLIQLSDRPLNYETPLDGFATPITPNDQFFIRYHLSQVPDMAALHDWSLRIGGDAAQQPARLSMADLRSLPAVEITAVCQCSGNRRGLFTPHVPGVQWGVGAMGNARWRGARLRDVLARAGVQPNAVEVAMQGADGPPLPATPRFAKSIPIDLAMNGDAMIAYEMNGAPLPHFNGFPARLVVPGWTGTYWMKHITTLELRGTPFDGFWMQKSYRVPAGMFPVAKPFATQDDAQTSPITEIVINTLVTSPADNARVAALGFTVQGIAWDHGSGVRMVDISTDGGKTWQKATLGEDLGRYAFRPWSFPVQGVTPGAVTVMVRATANDGAVQPEKLRVNPAGYHDNIIQTLTLMAA